MKYIYLFLAIVFLLMSCQNTPGTKYHKPASIKYQAPRGIALESHSTAV